MRAAPSRILAMLPDAATSGLFLLAWIAPGVLGPDYVASLMLLMMIEFIVMHSSAFYAVIAGADEMPRARRLRLLVMLSAIYLLFVLAFSLAFQAIWPLFAFGWLLASRFAHLWLRPLQGDEETRRMMLAWAGSGMTYVIGAFATAKLPLPALGVTPQFVASMHLSGSGEWIERPYTVLAFGAIYFAAQSWIKYALTGGEAAPDARMPRSP